MRAFLVLVPLVALAACATPREACIAGASHDLRVVNQLIAQTQANLARGYGLETRQDVVNVNRMCQAKQSDGSILRYPCDDIEVRDRRVPVALDLKAEQAKLDSLLKRQRELQTTTDAAIRQCVASYPEQ